MDSELAPTTPQPWFSKLGLRFYRYKALAKRRWWLLLITIGLGLLYEGWVLWSKPVEYQSVGRLTVTERISIDQARQFSEEQNYFYGTQMVLLQNPELQERAHRKMSIEAPQLSGKVELTASLAPRTSIFSVIGKGSHPEYTQRFVDVLMDEFIKFKQERRQDTTDVTMAQINDQLGRLRKEVDQHEGALQTFAEQNNMVFWEEQGKKAAVYLSELKTQQANLETELYRLEHSTPDQLLARPTTTPSTGSTETGVPPSSPDVPFTSDLNAQYLQKSQELMQKQAHLAEMSKVWKEKHPKLIAIKDTIASLDRLISTIKSQMQESTGSRIAAIKSELSSLEFSIAKQDQKVLETSRKNAEYERLKGALDREQIAYNKLLESMTSMDVAKGVSQESLSIMQKASPAVEVPRSTVMHLLIGVGGGLLVGIIFLVLLDRADDRISSSTEMIEHFSEPILAQIPNVIASRTSEGLPVLQKEDDRYTYAESFRSLRSSLVFMPNQSELRTLLVTSAIPNEGKSTIASNLAITMALAGARVLLVDADLRRGDLAALFDTDGRFGLSNVLRGEVDWRNAIQPTRYGTLSLLPRGPVTNQSGELLMVPLVDTLLEEFKEAYDLTIFNTAPILATDDTSSLAPNFDGTLMVIRAQFTSARMTHNALNALYQRQVNVLGMILNAVDTEMPDYYYYRYPKYYAA